MSLNVDPSQWRISYPKHHPATPGGDFQVKLMEGYPRLQIGKDDAMVEEQIVIEAEELGRFITDAFPLVSIESDTLKLPKTRTRVFPGLGTFEADSIEAEPFIEGLPADPFGLDPGAPEKTYSRFYRLTIKYGAPAGVKNPDGQPGDEIDPITFLERSCVATGEYLHTYGPYFYDTSGMGLNAEAAGHNQVGVPLILTVPEIEWTLKWPIIPSHLMENVIFPNMRARIGTVNNVAMPIFFNAAPETVLFLGYNIQQAFNWRAGFVETPPVQIEMKFLEKSVAKEPGAEALRGIAFGQALSPFAGHNDVWRAGVGWERIIRDPAKPNLGAYQRSDLNNMFRGVKDTDLSDEGWVN